MTNSIIIWVSGLCTGIAMSGVLFTAQKRRSYRRAYADAQRAIEVSARCRSAVELYAKLIDPSMGTPWDEGRTQRGNGNGGPTVPKPDIIPKPQPPGGRLIREGQWLSGYQPRPQGGTTNPPPEAP